MSGGADGDGPARRTAAPRQARRSRPDIPSGGDPVAHAREICLRQLAHRPRSRFELATTLRRAGVTDDVADAVLGRLDEVGLIDDEAFAAALVSSARTGRSMGRRALAHELRRRGIDTDISAAAIEVIDDDAEETAARGLVAKRLPALAGLPARVRARRLAGLLARKGYPADLARRVIDEMAPDTDDGDDDGGDDLGTGVPTDDDPRGERLANSRWDA